MEQLLIDGEFVSARATYANINPATGQEIGRAGDASIDDMSQAIGAARGAFDNTEWSADRTLRRHCLEQLLDATREHREQLRWVLINEAGVPVALTKSLWLDSFLDDLQLWIDMSTEYEYETTTPMVQTPIGPAVRRFHREPSGVVGAITPWNFSVASNLQKIFPALAAGCTIVLKPAPNTPWSATVIGQLIAEHTDIPPGVVNIVSGSSEEISSALVTDPRVDLIHFTGSTATGRKIMQNAAGTVKKLTLELGGKSAHIVLDDADFPAVLRTAGAACFHAGQGCGLLTRLLLPESRYDEGVDLVKKSLAKVRYGAPTDPRVMCGPLISKQHQERVLEHIRIGKSEAVLALGGGVPTVPDGGYFVEPTLFIDVKPDAKIAQEEIFGPVLVVIPYRDEDEAVEIANSTIYGLSGAVSSGDPDRALAVARRMRTGSVSVNGGAFMGQDAPLGGYKQSGLGLEFGTPGFEEFLQFKTIGLPAPQ